MDSHDIYSQQSEDNPYQAVKTFFLGVIVVAAMVLLYLLALSWTANGWN